MNLYIVQRDLGFLNWMWWIGRSPIQNDEHTCGDNGMAQDVFYPPCGPNCRERNPPRDRRPGLDFYRMQFLKHIFRCVHTQFLCRLLYFTFFYFRGKRSTRIHNVLATLLYKYSYNNWIGLDLVCVSVRACMFFPTCAYWNTGWPCWSPCSISKSVHLNSSEMHISRPIKSRHHLWHYLVTVFNCK